MNHTFCTYYIYKEYRSAGQVIARWWVLLLCIFQAVSLAAQVKRNAAYQQYFNRYGSLAVEQMKKYHIPASITLAQGVFESGAGKSELARKANNHFGIKCHGWTGRRMYYDDDRSGECFRAYHSVRDSYEDHSVFLSQGQRYKPLFRLSERDYKGWAHGLKKAGYATNPQYAYKLIDIIEAYELYQYDHASGGGFIYKHTRPNDPNPYTIYQFNKNYYVIAREGDTFKSIAKHVKVSYRSLARYNERDKRDVLQAGDLVYLKKKQTRAPKEFKHKLHVVTAGESMYTIAQKYGIRLKSLYKINRLPADYELNVGDRLLVR